MFAILPAFLLAVLVIYISTYMVTGLFMGFLDSFQVLKLFGCALSQSLLPLYMLLNIHVEI